MLLGTVVDLNNPGSLLGQRVDHLHHDEKEAVWPLTDNCFKVWVWARQAARAFHFGKLFSG